MKENVLTVTRMFPGRYMVRAASRVFRMTRSTHRGVTGIETAVIVTEVGTFHAFVTAPTFREAKVRLAEALEREGRTA